MPPAVLHGSGAIVPFNGQNEPGGHATQVAMSLAAGYCEYVPGAHAIPVSMRPRPVQYRPAGHALHTVLSGAEL